MTDTAKVPRNTEGGRPGRRPVVDDELAAPCCRVRAAGQT